MRRTTALLDVFSESRATDFERGSEAAGPAGRKMKSDANEHGHNVKFQRYVMKFD